MISGIYFVEFKASNNDFGQGLIVVDDGKVNGGDHSYLYRGRLDSYAGNVQAVLEISHYRGELDNVFGPLRQFTLNLSGISDENSFNVTGGVANIPGISIRVVGRKVAEIYK